jgi:hypothetical protein
MKFIGRGYQNVSLSELCQLLLEKVDESSLLTSLHSMLPEFGNDIDISLLLSQLYQHLSSEMITIGFYGNAILSGFAFVLMSHFHSDNVLLNYAQLRSAVLEHLCLSVDETILPEVPYSCLDLLISPLHRL